MVRIISHITKDFDVLIAGAGPAGASLAIHLRRLGYDVMLIDAQAFPRDKICGDFVSPIALKELEGLGISSEFTEANRIDRAAVYLDGQKLIEQSLPSAQGLSAFGKVIPRKVLDEKIFQAARASGASTLENCSLKQYKIHPSHVEALCRQHGKDLRIKAGLIVGADGSNSTVARQLNGSRHPNESKIIAVRSYYKLTQGPTNRADLFFSGKSFPGYYWVFPTSNDSANVGVGMMLETLPPVKPNLREMLEGLIKTDPALNRRLQGAELSAKLEAWPLSTFNPKLKITDDRVILIGDAGGLVNTLNGEGIQYALLSGRWAADTIHTAMQTNDISRAALHSFRARVDKEIGYDLALSRTIIQFIRNRNLNPLWLHMLKVIIQRASIDPHYAETAGGTLTGLTHANEVIVPGFLAKTAVQAGIHFGLKGAQTALGGPKQWKATAEELLCVATNVSRTMLKNPTTYLSWAGNIGKDMTRLTKFTLAEIL